MNGPGVDDRTEWLKPDGLGGYASGTTCGVRTRRYHALLVVAKNPPSDRVALVAGFDAWLEREDARLALTSQRYASGVVHPDGSDRIESFTNEPWPTWTYRIDDDLLVRCELFRVHEQSTVALRWSAEGEADGVRLEVRPFLSHRPIHDLHADVPDVTLGDHDPDRGTVVWWLGSGSAAIQAASNGRYRHDATPYFDVAYRVERDRGFDHVETLASPGVFSWSLDEEALLILEGTFSGDAESSDDEPSRNTTASGASTTYAKLAAAERRRRGKSADRLERAASAYMVRRGSGRTIMAGYPWFLDWSRDTFLSLRGLCLALGKVDEARDVVATWASTVSEGMIPNRFRDDDEEPQFNSVDASLWFVIAADAVFDAMRTGRRRILRSFRDPVENAMREILDGYAEGTRHGIRLEKDGLLACGEPGVQLTWMDARVGKRVVTPRIGKPVEVQALWLNALTVGTRLDPRRESVLELGRRSFSGRFWNDVTGALHDVVDVDHRPGSVDPSIRPNQILAVGGLPHMMLSQGVARQVVDTVERQLWTPLGLRALAPDDPAYQGRYAGGPDARDEAYHQGSVWPGWIGPFVEAWIRVRGGGASVKAEAREKFVEPLRREFDRHGLGPLVEVTDGSAPHEPGGAPFQAWSLAEFLRVDREILAPRPSQPGAN